MWNNTEAPRLIVHDPDGTARGWLRPDALEAELACAGSEDPASRHVMLRTHELGDGVLMARGCSPDAQHASRALWKPRPFDVEGRVRSALVAGAGAAFGVPLLATWHPQATIVAVEPDAANYALLERNAAPFPNVRTVNAALWHEQGGHVHLRIAPSDAKRWPSLQQRVKTAHTRTPIWQRVDAVSAAGLLRRFGLDGFDVAVLDIGGAEREVLSRTAPSLAWLERVRVLRVAVHERDAPGAANAVGSACLAAGFDGLHSVLNHTLTCSRRG